MLLRNANAAPRAIIPKAASVSGTYSVDATAANPAGNPVHSTTSTKISQTWLASQTGPIACSITRALAGAAAGAAREQVPDAGAEVGAAEQRVGDEPDEHDAEHDLGERHRTPASGVRAACPALAVPRTSCQRARRRSTYTVSTVSTA